MYEVYTFLTDNGTVLYVGCTSNFPSRIQRHYHKRTWFNDVAVIRRERIADRAEALAREQVLIRLHRPVHNVRHNPAAVRPLPAPPAPPRCQSGCDCPVKRARSAWARADYARATGRRVRPEYADGQPIPVGASVYEEHNRQAVTV